jgi:hypothetical protein
MITVLAEKIMKLASVIKLNLLIYVTTTKQVFVGILGIMVHECVEFMMYVLVKTIAGYSGHCEQIFFWFRQLECEWRFVVFNFQTHINYFERGSCRNTCSKFHRIHDCALDWASSSSLKILELWSECSFLRIWRLSSSSCLGRSNLIITASASLLSLFPHLSNSASSLYVCHKACIYTFQSFSDVRFILELYSYPVKACSSL